MILIITILIGAVVLTDFLLVILWIYFEKGINHKKDKEIINQQEWPIASILLAVRDEEENIERCLKSLFELDYPVGKIEILIGDDGSTDNTYSIAEGLIQGHQNCKLIRTQEKVGHQKGKANVLTQMIPKANGQYYLITDADMKLPKSWAKEMIAPSRNSIELVTGVTLVEDNKWQSIDWLFAISMVYILDCLGKPVTTMGNNMMVSKQAYDAVGGFDKIPFSITEDMELFRHVRNAGFKTKHLFKTSVLGFTKSAKGASTLFHQRKRWMRGAIQLKWPMVMLLIIQALYFPLIISLLILSPLIGIVFFLSKVGVQSLLIHLAAKRLKAGLSLLDLFLYEFYSWFVSIGSGLFYLSGSKVNWKGRKY